jgi:hypothetical protein
MGLLARANSYRQTARNAADETSPRPVAGTWATVKDSASLRSDTPGIDVQEIDLGPDFDASQKADKR